ncbi:hypothetical protein JCM11641_001802 [Rhodosporidiobolus odoratus]
MSLALAPSHPRENTPWTPSRPASSNALRHTLDSAFRLYEISSLQAATAHRPDSPPLSPLALIVASCEGHDAVSSSREPVPWQSSTTDELERADACREEQTRPTLELGGQSGSQVWEKELEATSVGEMPDSPPATPPADMTSYPTPLGVTASLPLHSSLIAPPPLSSSAFRRSASASPPSSPAALPTSSDVRASTKRMTARPSLPSLQTQLVGAEPSSPSLFTSTAVRPPPTSPRRKLTSLPTLAPIIVPSRSSSPSRSRSSGSSPSPPSSPTSPTSPSSLRSRPRSPTKPRARKRTPSSLSVSATQGPGGRGRSSSPRKAGEEGTSRYRRAGSVETAQPTLSPSSCSTSDLGAAQPASLKNNRSISEPLPLPLTPPLTPAYLPFEHEEDHSNVRLFEVGFQCLPLLRLQHSLSRAASLASFRAASALATSGKLPSTSVLRKSAGNSGSTTPGGGSSGDGRAAWQREQYRLYAMGKAKANRDGGVGYWQGMGFELE